MKNLFVFITIAIITFGNVNAQSSKKNDTIKIATSSVCSQCKERLESKMAFEKGVVNVSHDLETKICTIIYKVDKTEAKKRLDEICEAFDIDFLNDYIGDYSHGMKQKLMVATVLMRKPKVIFLDEPTVGLDAKSAKILKMLIQKYRDEGSTIFLTTHILEIAEKMCDRIGIIKDGSIIAQGTMEELRSKSTQHNKSLEDIFLELTGDEEIDNIVKEL